MKRIVSGLLLAVSSFWPFAGAARAEEDLPALLARHLERSGGRLPSLAAAVLLDGELHAVGATGVRVRGEKEEVTAADRYHIGSCTKSITATLAAALVEDGVIGWGTTVGEVLGQVVGETAYDEVTLEMLLSHRAGFSGEVPGPVWGAAWKAEGSEPEQRLAFVRAMLAEPPRHEPGTGYEYSNTGYAVAGVMLERKGGDSWENLVRARIFEPLGMESAGFGAPAGEGERDEPWGHGAKGESVAPGKGADNPAAIGPAGSVHGSVTDLARYARMHLLEETGPVLGRAESFQKLHTVQAPEGDYALGWIVVERGWAGGQALTHMGSNTLFTTVMWLAPGRKFAVVVATNAGADVAAKRCDAVVGDLIQRYLP